MLCLVMLRVIGYQYSNMNCSINAILVLKIKLHISFEWSDFQSIILEPISRVIILKSSHNKWWIALAMLSMLFAILIIISFQYTLYIACIALIQSEIRLISLALIAWGCILVLLSQCSHLYNGFKMPWYVS